jgi:hypothetical protein
MFFVFSTFEFFDLTPMGAEFSHKPTVQEGTVEMVLRGRCQRLRMVVELVPMFFGEALHSFGDIGEFGKDVLFFIRVGFHIE